MVTFNSKLSPKEQIRLLSVYKKAHDRRIASESETSIVEEDFKEPKKDE